MVQLGLRYLPIFMYVLYKLRLEFPLPHSEHFAVRLFANNSEVEVIPKKIWKYLGTCVRKLASGRPRSLGARANLAAAVTFEIGLAFCEI